MDSNFAEILQKVLLHANRYPTVTITDAMLLTHASIIYRNPYVC